MKQLPFCPECIYYAGRKNGKGTCTIYNPPLVAEHIGGEHWCIKGIKKSEMKEQEK